MSAEPASARVIRLGSDTPPGSVEESVRSATADPTARVLYWIEAEDCWVTAGGARTAPPADDERPLTLVELDGATVAGVELDGGRGLDDSALEPICRALAAAIRTEALAAELCARVRTLQATEQRLREVFEAIELVVIAMDLDATMTYVNQFTEQLSGWTRDDLLGQNWFSTFRSGREAFLERVRQGEFPTRDTSTIVLRSGERRRIEWYNVQLRDEAGRTTGVLGIGRDVTEELRARRSAEVSERRIRDVFETMQLLAAQVDLEGRITYVNEFLVRQSGWTREELYGRRWIDVFQSGSGEELARIREGVVDPSNVTSIVMRNGERRTIEWYNVALYDDEDALFGVVGLGRDISDQLRAEREVREFAAEHEALERVATAVARGMAGRAVFELVAEQAGRLVGADGCTLLRREDAETAAVMANWCQAPNVEIAAPGARQPLVDGSAVAASLASGRAERARAGRLDGFPSVVSAPITVSGTPWGALVAWRTTDEPLTADTERRLGAFASLAGTAISNAEARTALAASRKRLVSAGDGARRRLERNLHDGAQQRFVTLSLGLRLARARLPADPDAAAAAIDAASEELAQGLDELRELARGIHPAVLTDRGLQAALEALASRCTVPVDLTDVPETRLPAEVEATAYYVVAEALTNVARYSGATGAAVSLVCDGEVLAVTVRDDGGGGADPDAGSGLRGLADRVEAMGGRLELDSPSGEGTTVRARLPLTDPET